MVDCCTSLDVCTHARTVGCRQQQQQQQHIASAALLLAVPHQQLWCYNITCILPLFLRGCRCVCRSSPPPIARFLAHNTKKGGGGER